MRGPGSALRSLAERALWAPPFRFGLARALGPPYGLRCVLFHHVAEEDGPFTRGLGVTTHPAAFEAAVRFLAAHFAPVSLDRVLDPGRPLPERAVLVTFDDAYGSVPRRAAPILARHGVPAVFFVNAGLLGHRALALDNLLCWRAQQGGLPALAEAAARAGLERPRFASLREVVLGFVPGLARDEQLRFHEALLSQGGSDPLALAREADLYASEAEIAALAAGGVEIASHTWSHAWCRSLSGPELEAELGANRSAIERLTGRPVRAFSVPYGSSRDLTPPLLAALERAGAPALFLVEGRANPRGPRLDRIDRVSLRATTDAGRFFEIEVAPRLRRSLRPAARLRYQWLRRPVSRRSAQ
jgi:peptidoglycan/xylan/chitin deacetylase (PgdA/CDA1 family)